MTDKKDRIDQLHEKLENLLKRQESFSREINGLKYEINRLKISEAYELKEDETKTEPVPVFEKRVEVQAEKVVADNPPYQKKPARELPKYTHPKTTIFPEIKSDLERFIGENLINKIGIAIIILGVSIGAKYAIEHQLISPLIRILFGYMVGTGLLGTALKLKQKYENFSAVLLSGSMAIMYFMTYAAYSFYDLIPQVVTFLLMVLFTIFTVGSALHYNRQVIAHIGLVGAYAVPFLLSEGDGKVAVLFSYITIINIGILVIAFKKYWKPLYYSSFLLTWLIYFVWYVSKYQETDHYGLALVFLALFFVTFYLKFLVYKLLQKESFESLDILLLLSNSFLFYGIGYTILSHHEAGEKLLGLFTLCNAVVHLIVSVFVYRQQQADKNLFYLVSGLVWIYITLAIPVQLDGKWVTLLWAGETALLFWIGRTKQIPFYERFSYPLMFLAFISIAHDWATVYDGYSPGKPETRLLPLLNTNFLASLLFIASFGFINILNRNSSYSSPLVEQKGGLKIVSFAIPTILLTVIFYAFRMEIANYWNQLYADSMIKVGEHQNLKYHRNYDLKKFKTVWIFCYSLLYLSVLSFVNIKRLKIRQLGLINLGLNALGIIVFLTAGLYELSELRESFLSQSLSEYYEIGLFNIGIRYISFVFVTVMLIACYMYIRQEFMKCDLRMTFDLLLYGTILWIVSSELLNWMDIAKSTQSYKLGLSILWGTYSALLIVVGIWKKEKHLRIGAIALFGITLVKLFFYDIVHLDTLAKTIVFVSLGILLLIISFLYNKYKSVIEGENSKTIKT